MLKQCTTEEILKELESRGQAQTKQKAVKIEEAIKRQRLKEMKEAEQERKETKIYRAVLFSMFILLYLFIIISCGRYLAGLERPF